jgi:signal transduction histidine kinase
MRVLRRSLRAKVTLGVLLPLILILGAFSAIEYSRHRALVLSTLSILASHSGQVIESNLQHAMLDSDFDEVQALLDAVGESDEVRVLYLMDTSGRVIFAPNSEGVGSQLDHDRSDCQPCHQLSSERRPESVVITVGDGERVFRSMHPIENSPACAQCHDPNERLLGLLMTDISMASVEEPLAVDFRENLLWWFGTILVSIVVVNLAVSRFVLRRLEAVASAIAAFGKGRLPPPLAVNQPDEIGRVTSAFNLMAQQVEARNIENRQLSQSLRDESAQRGQLLKRLITAQEDERKRVARELHDELGQSLGGLALTAEAMEKLIASDPERALGQLGHIRKLVTETTDQMYELILALRPSVLDDLGLAAAVKTQAERVLAGTSVSFDLDDAHLTGRLTPEIETALYRVFQEALTNVVRHAEAKQVRITLARRSNSFEGEIVDDGKGFDPSTIQVDGHSPQGLGLLGMQERVTQCSGRMEVISEPGGGTRLRIRIPLTEVSNG